MTQPSRFALATTTGSEAEANRGDATSSNTIEEQLVKYLTDVEVARSIRD